MMPGLVVKIPLVPAFRCYQRSFLVGKLASRARGFGECHFFTAHISHRLRLPHERGRPRLHFAGQQIESGIKLVTPAQGVLTLGPPDQIGVNSL